MISGCSRQAATAASTSVGDMRHGRQQTAAAGGRARRSSRTVSPNGSISRVTSPRREPGSTSSVFTRSAGSRGWPCARLGRGAADAGSVRQPMADIGAGRAAKPAQLLRLERQDAEDWST